MNDPLNDLIASLALDARFDEGKLAGVRVTEWEATGGESLVDWPSEDALSEAEWEADLTMLRRYAFP